jgi:branched-chain amino acid transport system permease protein
MHLKSLLPAMLKATPSVQVTGDLAVLLRDLQFQRVRNIKVMLLLLLLVAVVLPQIANGYWIKTLISAMSIAVAVSGASLLYGQLGLVSLCQFALVGVGGWVSLRLSHGLHLPFELCVLAAGVFASATGMVAGLPALRMKGLYLALVTLMMAGGYQVLISALGFPDGGTGWLGRAQGTDRTLMARPLMAESDGLYLSYVIVWLAAVLLLVELHKLSKPGRAWALIRRGEAAANAAGVDVLRNQTWAFGLAGFCAGVGGALLAGGVGQLDGRAFGASESVMLFALAVVGGVYHWLGVLLAGLLLRAVPALLTDYGVNGYLATMFFGASLLHALTTAHRGIAGQWMDAMAAIRRRITADPRPAEPRND